MLGQQEQNWETRAHFLNSASQAMRRLLVDHARKRVRQKRGGGKSRRSLQLVDSLAAPGGMPAEDLLGLDDALDRLKEYEVPEGDQDQIPPSLAAATRARS